MMLFVGIALLKIVEGTRHAGDTEEEEKEVHDILLKLEARQDEPLFYDSRNQLFAQGAFLAVAAHTQRTYHGRLLKGRQQMSAACISFFPVRHTTLYPKGQL